MKSGWIWIVAIAVAVIYILNKYTVPSASGQSGGGSLFSLLGFGAGSPSGDVSAPGAISGVYNTTPASAVSPQSASTPIPISGVAKIVTSSTGQVTYGTGRVSTTRYTYGAPLYRTYA